VTVSLTAPISIPEAPIDASSALPTLPIGASGPPFHGLLAVDGRLYDMADFADRDALVLIFSSNRCPTAKAYAGRMRDLQAEYGPRGVQVLAINSNDPHLYPEESYGRMAERAADDGYTFPYLFDDGQRLARAYGPQRTFHVFVLDRDRRLRYEGRFDDARLAERVTTHDLRNALDDVLAGREVRVPTTKAFGCSLDLT
jgi:peroxiredoxin